MPFCDHQSNQPPTTTCIFVATKSDTKKKRIQENFIKLRMGLQLSQLDTNQKREDCSSLFSIGFLKFIIQKQGEISSGFGYWRPTKTSLIIEGKG